MSASIQADADKFAMAMLIASADSEGEIIAGDDGLYVYWPTGFSGGALSAWVLRGLADELDRRNEAWHAQVEEYFADPIPHETEVNHWLDKIETDARLGDTMIGDLTLTDRTGG